MMLDPEIRSCAYVVQYVVYVRKTKYSVRTIRYGTVILNCTCFNTHGTYARHALVASVVPPPGRDDLHRSKYTYVQYSTYWLLPLWEEG